MELNRNSAALSFLGNGYDLIRKPADSEVSASGRKSKTGKGANAPFNKPPLVS
jgi:hypothetical protein